MLLGRKTNTGLVYKHLLLMNANPLVKQVRYTMFHRVNSFQVIGALRSFKKDKGRKLAYKILEEEKTCYRGKIRTITIYEVKIRD